MRFLLTSVSFPAFWLWNYNYRNLEAKLAPLTGKRVDHRI